MKHILILSMFIVYPLTMVGQITVSLPDMEVSEPYGTVIEIPLTVPAITGLNVIAFQFEIHFDPEVITPEAPFFVREGTLSDSPDWTVMANPDAEGVLGVGAFGAAPLTGSGALLKIVFKIVSTNGSCPLEFDSFIYNNGTPSVTPVNGFFSNQYSVLPPVYRHIESITIADGENLCFDAYNEITVANAIVEAGGSAVFIAGQRIVFLPGTLVQHNAYMHAYITEDESFCLSPKSIVASEETIFIHDKAGGAIDDGNMLFRVWPNPFMGKISVKLLDMNKHGSSPIQIEVYNMMGRRVYGEMFAGVQQHKIDLSFLPTGLYFIRVSTDDQLHTERLIRY